MSIISTAANYFLDPNWSYALLLIIPFILLYLIRPKPRYQVMPSLMFLFKDLGRNRTSNFLRKLITNLLFLLQLFALLLILLSVAKPFVNVPKESLFRNTVLVVDASASMKADYEGGTRFEKAVEIAKENLGSVNTLIIVKKTPDVILEDESAGKVRSELDKLSATDETTNLFDAISAAGAYAKGDSRVLVLSDFLDTDTDTDIGTIRKTLEAQGTKVDFIRLHSPVPNVGIVDLQITDAKTSAVIMNYNEDPAQVHVKIGDLEEDMQIPGRSKELFTFSTPPRTSELQITSGAESDRYPADNTAFVSAPSDVKKKVLFLTNNNAYERTYLYNAFQVMKGVQVDVAVPPKIPDLEGYDVFIFKDVNPNLILPGTVKGIKKEVEENGKAAVIMASPGFGGIDYQGMLNVNIEDEVAATTNIFTSGADALTNNIEFGVVKKYMPASANRDSVVVIAASENNTPMITFSNQGDGKTFYYGIMDEDKESDSIFAKSPAYYVFWKRTIDFLTDTPSVRNLNYKTGLFLTFPAEQPVKTPHGEVTGKNIALDENGFYRFRDRTVAANLIDERESDVSREATLEESSFLGQSERFKEEVPFELTDYLIYGALLLLFAELLYVKFRGDF